MDAGGAGRPSKVSSLKPVLVVVVGNGTNAMTPLNNKTRRDDVDETTTGAELLSNTFSRLSFCRKPQDLSVYELPFMGAAARPSR